VPVTSVHGPLRIRWNIADRKVIRKRISKICHPIDNLLVWQGRFFAASSTEERIDDAGNAIDGEEAYPGDAIMFKQEACPFMGETKMPPSLIRTSG
jgi:hypothetical protein